MWLTLFGPSFLVIQLFLQSQDWAEDCHTSISTLHPSPFCSVSWEAGPDGMQKALASLWAQLMGGTCRRSQGRRGSLRYLFSCFSACWVMGWQLSYTRLLASGPLLLSLLSCSSSPVFLPNTHNANHEKKKKNHQIPIEGRSANTDQDSKPSLSSKTWKV